MVSRNKTNKAVGDNMDIVCIRIGEKYGPEYEDYLNKKLSKYNIIWIREPYHPKVTLQWNKMWGMQLQQDEPICVMDIDVLLLNDYEKIFETPIEPGQFLAMPGWWRDTKKSGYYIKNETTKGPVNGEQYFIEDSVKE